MSESSQNVTRSGELLPCPFCGGEAEVAELDWMYLHGFVARCANEECIIVAETNLYPTEAEAIEAWNTRAGGHCAFAQPTDITNGCALLEERACECVAEYAESPIDGKTIVLHRCSECHDLMRPTMRYCPNCGAKVIKE